MSMSRHEFSAYPCASKRGGRSYETADTTPPGRDLARMPEMAQHLSVARRAVVAALQSRDASQHVTPVAFFLKRRGRSSFPLATLLVGDLHQCGKSLQSDAAPEPIKWMNFIFLRHNLRVPNLTCEVLVAAH
jgi:hypothetical protein